MAEAELAKAEAELERLKAALAESKEMLRKKTAELPPARKELPSYAYNRAAGRLAYRRHVEQSRPKVEAEPPFRWPEVEQVQAEVVLKSSD